MNNFEYVVPTSVEDASKQAAHPDAALRAGGVDLIDLMRNQVVAPERLVNLRHLTDPALRAVTRAADGWHIGALVTLATVADHAELPAVLKQAAQKTATPQIRNAATAGGNLAQRPRCWYFRSPAFHCRKKGGETCFSQNGDNRYHAVFDHDDCAIVHPSNLAPALVALDARVVTSRRTLPIEQLFVLPADRIDRENVLEPGEIIRELVIPSGLTGGAYRDAREKGSFDWALVSAAAWLSMENGVVKHARLSIGAVSPVPRRAAAAEAAIVGKKLTLALATRAAEAAFAEAQPMTHNAYKLPLGRTVLRRAILGAAGLPESAGA